jgi:hypothetical protein
VLVPNFGEQLALGFKPIGISIAGKSEPTAALGNEVGAHRDLLVGRIELN